MLVRQSVVAERCKQSGIAMSKEHRKACTLRIQGHLTGTEVWSFERETDAESLASEKVPFSLSFADVLGYGKSQLQNLRLGF